MKKNFFKMFLFGFVSLFVSNEFVAAANDPIQISYGTVFNFIQGAMYDGVKCDIPADTGDFVFTTTSYSDDHYVEVPNPNAASGTLSFECSYAKKKAHSGANAPVISTDGVEKFVFEIVPPKDLTKFNMELHRQFRYFVDMKTYFTVGTNTGIDNIQLSSELQSVFENSSGSVTCNSQSCILYLKQDAKVGVTTGKIKYGNYEFELTVNVKDEWVVYANTGGYGRCDFEEVGGGWELNGKNSNFFEKAISGKTVALPRCVADNTFDNRYMALEFVGWVYNKKSVNDNYNNYQSIDVCATFKDNSDPNIGFVSGGGAISPSQMTFAHRGNSIFYACYKKTGIGFNLLGAKVNDDTYQITKWNLTQREGDVTPGIYYKVFDDNTSTMILPSKVEPSGLVDNEVFVGWVNNRDGHDKVIPGGTEVSVKEGLIYTPHFMIEKAETERSVTVYTKNKIVIELPSSFTCVSGEKTNFSVVGSGNKCVITGIKSSNGDHLDYPIKNGNKTYTLKILVVEGSYSDNENIPPVEIGNGDLIVDDDGEGNVSVTNPVDCKLYYVGRRGAETIKSIDFFKYQHSTESNINYNGHIFTYYARSACYTNQPQLETEYAALCLDPGRASPARSISSIDKNGNGISVSKYAFDRYINVKDEERDYREFSKAVAHIVSKLGILSLDDFNQPNNDKKVAANIALRIVATQYPLISVKPSNGDIKYVNAFMAYQSMAMHLGYDGNADHSNIGKDRPIKGVPENNSICETTSRSLYVGCNEEWQWIMPDVVTTPDNGASRSYTRADLLNLIGEYLSYGANESLEKDNWEIVPKLKYERRDGNTIYFNLTYPRSIKFRYGENNAYDITLNLSERMAKVYQFEERVIGSTKHIECIDTVRTNGNCHRYAVRMITDNSPQAPEANHPIILDLIINPNATMIFPDPEARDIYLEVGYSSAYTSQSAFLVEPLDSGDYQRMVLFNPERVVKIFPLNLYDCNVLLQNYGNDSSKYEQIYKAGCCETISDGSTEYQDFVNTYCKKDCVMNNFKPICNSHGDETNYEIAEAITKHGNTNYACIVDVRNMGSLTTTEQLSVLGGGSGEKEPFTNTSKMTDLTGQNSIAIDDYNNNPYCRITCKENWSFNMPGYGDFLGTNAVAAGSLFQINQSINLSSTVTCVSTHIDVDGYLSSVEGLTESIYNEYYDYSLRAATHDDIRIKSTGNSSDGMGDDKTWYTYSYSDGNDCGISQVNAGISSCSISGVYKKQCADNASDYSNHSECRKVAKYQSTADCNATDVANGVSGCGVTGRYKPLTYNECMGHGGTDAVCKKDCTMDTLSQDGCSLGTKTVMVDCGSGDYSKQGCGVDTSQYYQVSYCTASDYVNGSFYKSGLTNNCSIDGDYTIVTRHTHSGNGSSGTTGCRVYEIYTVDETSVMKYTSTGASNNSIMHGDIYGDLDTGYTVGDYECGSSSTCERSNGFRVTDGTCDTKNNKTGKDFWKSTLISRAYYEDDTGITIKSAIDDHYDKYSDYLSYISKLSNAFAICQNFNIKNTTADTSTIKVFGGTTYTSGNDNVQLLDSITDANDINTKLEPSGTFGYDEDYYMSLMGSDRTIERNSDISIAYKTEMYSDSSTTAAFGTCYGIDGKYLSGDETKNCTDSVDTSNPEAKWYSITDSNVVGGYKQVERVLCNLSKDYSYNSSTDVCAKTYFYYYDANYIKKSLTSSANYDNNITWYRYTANDKIFPGKGMGTAASKADAASRYSNYSLTEDEYNLWSAMGTKNVFPVSLNTRRNIYQYYYTFKGIGNYYNGAYASDRNSIGRLMGYENSIIKSNSRVCFYEVYESACICCGQNDLGVVSSGSGINSYEYVGYTPSGMGSGSGHYGFTTSTVSLYNLKGFSSNANSSNWSAGETYFYDGSNKYKTDKGKELAGYIEQKGENVYAEIPEYSYVLTPNAMANIRKNNTEGKYGYGRDTIYAVENGTYLAHSGNKNHIPNSNETSRIIFTHFGSNFVKNELSAYETPEYKGKLLSNMSMSSECYVEKNGISSLEDKKKKGCKWVDYVQPVNSDGSGGYFRMAFK